MRMILCQEGRSAAFCVDGEVFEGDFEIVFVAFLRPTYLPIALAELSVDELLWDADVGHVEDVA